MQNADDDGDCTSRVIKIQSASGNKISEKKRSFLYDIIVHMLHTYMHYIDIFEHIYIYAYIEKHPE